MCIYIQLHCSINANLGISHASFWEDGTPLRSETPRSPSAPCYTLGGAVVISGPKEFNDMEKREVVAFRALEDFSRWPLHSFSELKTITPHRAAQFQGEAYT